MENWEDWGSVSEFLKGSGYLPMMEIFIPFLTVFMKGPLFYRKTGLKIRISLFPKPGMTYITRLLN